MITEEIIRSFKESVCGEIDLTSYGINRYLVHVPLTFSDGDHYVIILKPEAENWILSDEGHTLMHLSYELRDREYESGNRRRIIDGVLNSYQITNRDGELIFNIPMGRYGDALFTFVQAITQISDTTFLDRENVRSTFCEDFNRLVSERAAEAGISGIIFRYTHPTKDPLAKYPVDVRLNGVTAQQVFIFGINNDADCQTATIVLLQWEKWNEAFHSIAVFRDQTEINRQYLARFSDVANRQLPNLDSAKDRLAKDFKNLLIGSKIHS